MKKSKTVNTKRPVTTLHAPMLNYRAPPVRRARARHTRQPATVGDRAGTRENTQQASRHGEQERLSKLCKGCTGFGRYVTGSRSRDMADFGKQVMRGISHGLPLGRPYSGAMQPLLIFRHRTLRRRVHGRGRGGSIAGAGIRRPCRTVRPADRQAVAGRCRSSPERT